MPGSLTVKWIFKNTKEKIKACNLSEKQNGRNSLAKQVLFYLKTAKKISCLQTRSGLLLCPVFILQQATKKKKNKCQGFKCMRSLILSFPFIYEGVGLKLTLDLGDCLICWFALLLPDLDSDSYIQSYTQFPLSVNHVLFFPSLVPELLYH